MQETSALWRTLLDESGTVKEIKAVIDGATYGQDEIYGMTVTGALYDTPTTGKCASREIELQIIPKSGDIPRRAKIVPYVRLVNGNQTSEWLKKGEFYVDTRDTDEVSGAMTIHGYDALTFCDRVFEKALAWIYLRTGSISFDSASVVDMILSELRGLTDEIVLELDSRVELMATSDFSIAPLYGEDTPDTITTPEEYTDILGRTQWSCREILGYIAAMHGGNWTITDEGKLYIVPLEPSGYVRREVLGDENGAVLLIGGIAIQLTSGSGTIGGGGDNAAVVLTGNSKDLQTGKAFPGWAGVRFTKSGKVVAESGNFVTDGAVLSVECPCGTPTAAAYVLGKITGAVYRPYSAFSAIIDPAVKLGDMATVNGAKTVVARMDWHMDSLFSADLAAPGEYETEDSHIAYSKPVDVSTQRAIDSTVKTALVNDALQIRIVDTLPTDHASKNILWVIPDG